MATPEGKVKLFVDKIMLKAFPGIWKYNPPGGAFGRAGIPDKIFLWKGVMIAIEVKSETGQPTKLQLKRLNELRDQGCIAAIVKGCDEARMNAIINAVNAELKRRGME